MATHIVTYQVNDSTTVPFEVESIEGFQPAAPGHVLGRVWDAVGPAVDAAKVVLDKAKDAGPDQVKVTFGVKVSGGADWIIAKSAGEGSFEITLAWARDGEAGKGGE